MSPTPGHAEWLSLVDKAGPSLSPSVLEAVFPQGLEKVDSRVRKRLRSAYDEWCDAVDDQDPELEELHTAWAKMVLRELLEYEDRVLVGSPDSDERVASESPDPRPSTVPSFALQGGDGICRLLISIHPPQTDLERAAGSGPSLSSPAESMASRCQAAKVPIGLVTNGEQWMAVNAPDGVSAGYLSWYARIWWQEPVTLRAFQSLLGVRRAFGPEHDRLDKLFERSLVFQESMTDTLGEQVRRAVEILVQALGRADQDRSGRLLDGVSATDLYDAGLTVMMRLVFLLCAEERGLLMLGDPVYDQHYAVSTLRMGLREDMDRLGLDVLERRHDAWSRLLSVFRAVYAGVEHDLLRMPAMGGSLFDPDRHPFLEGRARGSAWQETPATPLPIDNRTVLLLLEALQVLEQRGGAQFLSYKTLDVEQIGHVYEGLLEYRVVRVPDVTLGLVGSQKVPHPALSLAELEELKKASRDRAAEQLADLTGRSASAIGNALERGGDDDELFGLIHACGGDEPLARRILPFAGLVRADSWGTMLVYKAGSFTVAPGETRRETGTHYTPRSLTEEIVRTTLGSLVYVGPSDGSPREEWRLRSPAELLDMRICDPAMGSGAFLVQVCRWLSERLVEAWAKEEGSGKVLSVDGEVLQGLGSKEPMPSASDERLLMARRLIAERCLYGVDLNPLAVELAKLSVWLVTLSKGRPFGFLDHNLRCGDSLLGITSLDQLTNLDLHPEIGTKQRALFSKPIRDAVDRCVELRTNLRALPVRDIRDVDAMARLDQDARESIERPRLLADCLVGEALRTGSAGRAFEVAKASMELVAERLLRGDADAERQLHATSKANLRNDLSAEMRDRRPFHWPLEFAEVFARGQGGFDALVGNPPYAFGEIRPLIVSGEYEMARGQWDLCWLFIERAFHLIASARGSLGFVLPDAILAREEPGLVRALVVEKASDIVVKHVGGVFTAGVSVFTLCVSLSPHANSSFTSLSGAAGPWSTPLSVFKADPARIWNVLAITGDLNTDEWVPLGSLATISRGEEVGKKDLVAFTEGNVPPGTTPVVAGAGVVEVLQQPRPTHLIAADLVRKDASLYEAPKIIAVKTGIRIRAGIDTRGLVTLQSAYNIHLKPTAGHLTIEFLCAILVSGAANRIFIEPITRMKKLFPQITQGMITGIRIPPVSRDTVDEVTGLVRAWTATHDAKQLARIDELLEKCYSARAP